MKVTKLLFVLVASIGLAYGCDSETGSTDPDNPFLEIEAPDEDVPGQQNELTVEVKSNVKWTATPGNDWLRVSPATDKFTVFIDTNLGDPREGTVTVSGPGVDDKIVTVKQKGGFHVDRDGIHFTRLPEDYETLEIKDALDSWSWEKEGDWFSVYPSDSGLDVYAEDNFDTGREGRIILKPLARPEMIISVTQAGLKIVANDISGRYSVTGTVVRESTDNPTPTQWECTITVDDVSEGAFKVSNYTNVELTYFSIYASMEDEPLAEFWIPMPYSINDHIMNEDIYSPRYFFQPAVFYDGEWEHPYTGETKNMLVHQAIGVNWNPESGDDYVRSLPYMELKFSAEEGTLTYSPPMYKAPGFDEERPVGIGWRSAASGKSYRLLGYKTGYYTNLVFTRIGDLEN